MEIKEKKMISNPEALELLEAQAKKRELNPLAKNSLEILKRFTELSAKQSQDIRLKLEQIKGLTERQKLELINFKPSTRDELRLILQKTYASLSEEERKLILESFKKV